MTPPTFFGHPPFCRQASAGSGSGAKLFAGDLFLYPGVYEYKYIVDGVWMVDKRKEAAVNKSGHENNIIRVGPEDDKKSK